ncbi:MAG: alpha-2-macroglobulin [Winogradskyella sp.]|uniref:alpha-2-macroglobulin family protein n=1 Tax=Winogradskyella sp. TaxID=1883156 RepID=UPI0017B38CF9|nr:alpha-2-macroglobulin [Winogradskyella sp.]
MKTHFSIFLLLFFTTIINAQTNLDSKWEKVTALEKEGLTKSAAKLVNEIYEDATAANNKQQQIKALLHKSKYMLTLEEDAQLNIVNLFKAEIDATQNIVTKHLLENMLATLYWQYFQQNRYKFYNRTNTTEKVSDDFRTWDLETLFNEIHVYYQRSLENGLLLQQEPLSAYTILLNEAKNSQTYRPTLFDLLSHNALEFYKTDENSINQPTYKFKLDNELLISDSETFINLDLASKDSLSLQLNALKIYQNLIKFHRQNSKSRPFVAIDIERLNFVFQHASFHNKADLMLNSLIQKAEQLANNPLSTLYNFEIASIFYKQGNQYNSSTSQGGIDQTNRWKLKDALGLCNNVISNFSESEGAKKCEVLKQQILLPSLSLKTESFIPVNSPSRILVDYKNLTNLEFKVYKVTKNQLIKFNDTYNAIDKEKFFDKLSTTRSFSSILKTEGDYQVHSTELILPALPNGLYLIKANTNSDENIFATAHIQITDLALVENSERNAIHYQLIDRNNGKPMVNAVATITYKNNRNKSFSKIFLTDRFGKFSFNRDRNYYRAVNVAVDYKGDTAYFGDYYISRKYIEYNDNDIEYNIYLFTDRSIYRPGQTVYFKGIVTTQKDGKTEVSANNTCIVKLKNVNGEAINELKLSTNDYGSVSGEFILPDGGLTGSYSIEMFCGRKGSTYFSVEEYKRPKFKSKFQPVTDTFQVNDTISVSGTSIAFAGSNVTNAKVVYRVKRQVQYPYWYYWQRPIYNSEAQEITFGETKTNDKGEFTVAFKAIPDEDVAKENLPVFRYEVTADITDINGETRSATTIVNVGYHAMTLKISAPAVINKSKKEVEIAINSMNLNGEEVPAIGSLKVYKLEAPEYVLRTRPWEAPDYQVISNKEFKELFLHDPYNNEHLLKNWKKGKEVFSTSFNTENEKTIELKKLKKWDSGKYLIVAVSQDKFGQDVKDEIFTTLFSQDDKTVADNQLFEASLNKDSFRIGDMVKLSLGSAAKDITVTVEIEKEGRVIRTHLVKLSNSKQTIDIPVSKGDLGGFEVHTSLAAFNSYIAQSFRVNVPYPNSDLEIETKTFRDKLQPGHDETWSFKIKGPKGDKITAELLASMYDASLDEFNAHNWSFNPINTPFYYGQVNKDAGESFGTTRFRLFNRFASNIGYPAQSYDQLNWFGFNFGHHNQNLNKSLRIRGNNSIEALNSPIMMVEDSEDDLNEVGVVGYGTTDAQSTSESISDNNGTNRVDDSQKNDEHNSEVIHIRKNLSETAFFFPQLLTDSEGNVSFNFKAPEALTKWKLQLLAHTKTLESAVKQLEAITQKELMIIPNAPRFLRESDTITISTKIANLTQQKLSGVAELILTNPVTGEEISKDILGVERRQNDNSQKGTSTTLSAQNFSVGAKGNTQVSWILSVPEGIQVVQYKIVAKAGNFSDGEQNALPVLSNRMMVTETMPMWVRSNQTKTFTLDKLKNNTSTTLSHHKLTLEMTSNPAWYAIQALPYLMEYPYDCNEQTFARYYSNALAQHIVTSNPKIEAVFNQWKSTNALLSNLEKNEELKSMLIQETPWLRDAQSETEQKKRIGLLFDLNKMNIELSSALRKLKQNQLPSGAWPWFNGGYANRYITQHIIGGFGHLKKLDVTTSPEDMAMIQNALSYLDIEFIQEYKDLKKHNKAVDLTKDHLSYTQLHYLYVRSFYPELKPSKEVETIMAYYKDQIQKYWLKRSLYAKGLMALSLHRMDDTATAGKIINSLKENSITSNELGMYWKENTNSWHWHQAPIETQALLIEAFSEVGPVIQSNSDNLTDIDHLKIWLLKNKQTNSWKTTKATTEAVYALLLQGSSWLDVTEMVDIKVGKETISSETLDDVKVEAGTGYYKTSWTGSGITPEMADVSITKKGDGIAWGAMYWQYFEDLDKITSAETPLKLSKKLFLKKNTEKGEEISEITTKTQLQVGDLVRVRIELSTDRPMEFVHLKDMRAAGFEPVNVLSQYKWQDGLGYYESTKDAATNFFMSYLSKGVYVFEYDLRANNAGNMSNGISTIQSMYAPEFSSHSEGVRVTIE